MLLANCLPVSWLLEKTKPRNSVTQKVFDNFLGSHKDTFTVSRDPKLDRNFKFCTKIRFSACVS